MTNIFWTEIAEESHFRILDYLDEHWGLDIILRFETQDSELLANLSANLELCPSSKIYIGIRRCVINKNVSMLY